MNNDIKEKPTPDNTIEIDVNKLKTSNIKLNKIFKEKDDWFIEYYDIKEILSKMERLIVYGQYNAYYDLEKQLLDYITNLQEKYNKALEILVEYGMPCERDNFNLLDTDYCELNCSNDDEQFKKCWNKFIEWRLKDER